MRTIILAVLLCAGAAAEDLVPYAPGGKRKGTVGGGPACLAAGTRVLTPKGEVAIELLSPGDEVFSMDERAGSLVAQPVAATRRQDGAKTLRLRLAGRKALLATAEHPLYDPDARSYRPAGAFAAGGRVASAGAAGLAALEVAAISPGPRAAVFDLVVGGAHRNFIAEGVLVHNKGAGGVDPAVAAAFKEKAQAAATAARGEGLRLVPVAEILAKRPGLAGKRVAVLGVLHELHATANAPGCTLRGRKFDETLPAGLSRLAKERRKRLLQVYGKGGDQLLLLKGVLRPDVPSGRPEELYLDVDAFQEVGAVPPGLGELPDVEALR